MNDLLTDLSQHYHAYLFSLCSVTEIIVIDGSNDDHSTYQNTVRKVQAQFSFNPGPRKQLGILIIIIIIIQ